MNATSASFPLVRQWPVAEGTFFSDEDEALYYISNPELDIMVWGAERQEADEAFQFSFISLVQNIYNEDDANLMKKARKIKKKLATLIDHIK